MAKPSTIGDAALRGFWQHARAMAQWVVLLHVVAAFWFVAGLLSRNITMARARTATDIRTLDELVTLSGRFERMMVIPGSFAVVVLGLLAAWALGQPLAGANDWWLLISLVLFLVIGALVQIVFLPHGKVFEHEFADAKARGEITTELRTALRDPVVRNARAAELVVVAVIITLMVTKPF
jgi:uncharacterized membrane protein